MQQQQFDAANREYGRLLKAGKAVDEIINDLETAHMAGNTNTTLLQLLGDAYMRNDQLEKALEAYKLALAKL